MSRNGKRARTALTVALVWGAASGTAVAGTGTGAMLPWGGGRAAATVALQAAAQELAAWEAGQDTAYEAAVRKAVSDAERWRAAATTTVSGTTGQLSASQGQDQGQGQDATAGGSTADGSTAGGSDQTQGPDWGARIEEALETPHPRPGSTPGTDPEHRQSVEDAYTDSVKDLTYDPVP